MRSIRRLRYKIRGMLLFILLISAIASGISCLFKNISIFEDDPYVQLGMHESFTGPDIISKYPVDKELSLDIVFLRNNYFYSRINLEEYDFKGIKIKGDAFIKGKVSKDNSGTLGFTGKLFSSNIFFGEVPFKKLSMSFKAQGNMLEIEDMKLGETYELKGRLSLLPPYETELSLTIDRADIRDLAILASVRDPNIALGAMRGVLNIKGPLANPSSSGHAESRNGKIGPIEYSLITVKLEGIGPIISIVDSTIKQKNKGLLTMDGYFDLRNMAKGNMLDGVRVKSDMMTIVWDGWDIGNLGKDELSMTKEITDTMKIGFKTMATERATKYSNNSNEGEMSLEYKIGMENLKMKLKDDEEFLVVEHNIKF